MNHHMTLPRSTLAPLSPISRGSWTPDIDRRICTESADEVLS